MKNPSILRHYRTTKVQSPPLSKRTTQIMLLDKKVDGCKLAVVRCPKSQCRNMTRNHTEYFLRHFHIIRSLQTYQACLSRTLSEPVESSMRKITVVGKLSVAYCSLREFRLYVKSHWIAFGRIKDEKAVHPFQFMKESLMLGQFVKRYAFLAIDKTIDFLLLLRRYVCTHATKFGMSKRPI